MLRGKKPEKIEKRLKMFVYGKAGVGKTTAAIQFPNAYIIDLEHGCDFYSDTIAKNGSVVFHSNEAKEIKTELRALLTEKHSYKTLIIDPMTILYHSIQEDWASKFEKEALRKNKTENAEMQDFGMRFWGKVKSEYKSIQRLLDRLDMNIIVTSHQKDVYGANSTKIGTSWDSMKGDDHFFDYIFQLDVQNNKRIAVKIKERAEIDESKFPDAFPWAYNSFLEYYGDIIEREAEAIELPTPEEVDAFGKMVDVLSIPQDMLDKWYKKADVDSVCDMDKKIFNKCMKHMKDKLNDLAPEKEDKEESK